MQSNKWPTVQPARTIAQIIPHNYTGGDPGLASRLISRADSLEIFADFHNILNANFAVLMRHS